MLREYGQLIYAKDAYFKKCTSVTCLTGGTEMFIHLSPLPPALRFVPHSFLFQTERFLKQILHGQDSKKKFRAKRKLKLPKLQDIIKKQLNHRTERPLPCKAWSVCDLMRQCVH